MKDEIIAQIAQQKIVETIVDNIGTNDPDLDDLKQDIYIELLSKDEDLIVDLYKKQQLRFYITKMVINNIKSKTSLYYYKYKKHKEKIDYVDDINKFDEGEDCFSND